MKKYFYIIGISILCFSCHKSNNELKFDMERQIFCNCDNSPIRNLSITNDSISKNGFLFEGTFMLYWNGKKNEKIPKKINLSNIPDNYILTKGGLPIKVKNYKLKPLCSYLVEKKGFERPSFLLRIWTDSNGKIFKTTHSKCGLKSLDTK